MWVADRHAARRARRPQSQSSPGESGLPRLRAPPGDLPHHRVPEHPQRRTCPATVSGHDATCSAVASRGPLGEHRPWREGGAGWAWSPCLDLSPLMSAQPNPLDPTQHHRPPTDRQIPDPARTAVVRGATAPQPGQATRSALVWINNSNSLLAFAAASTSNPSKPNSARRELLRNLLHIRYDWTNYTFLYALRSELLWNLWRSIAEPVSERVSIHPLA